MGVLTLVFAMTILNDFKTYAFENPEKAANKDPIEFILNAASFSQKIDKTIGDNKELKRLLYLKAIGRFTYVNEATQVIRYKEVKGLKNTDPNFLRPFLTFPFFAIVPQYWILGEEAQGIGAWVTQLLSKTRKYDTAMSPIGYSYLAGGPGLVLVVFFIFGVLMKSLEYIMRNIHGVIAFILFLNLLKWLVLFDTVVSATFLNLIRYALLLPPLLWLVFKKW